MNIHVSNVFIGIHVLTNVLSYIAEVVEAKREELNKLKEQLLISFKDQMELRYSYL